jgi:hypothetical protein
MKPIDYSTFLNFRQKNLKTDARSNRLRLMTPLVLADALSPGVAMKLTRPRSSEMI